MKKLVRLVLVFLAALFGVTFTYLNPQTAKVSYYLGLEWEGPLSLLLLGVFVVGGLLGMALSLPALLRSKRKVSAAKRNRQRSESQERQLVADRTLSDQEER